MTKFINSIFYTLIAILAIFVSLYAFMYYVYDFPYLQIKGNLPSETYWSTAFYTHVGSGGVALGIGWIQFWKKFRLNNIRRHRLLGKIYVTSILVFASTSGQYLAWYASEGFGAQLGFACLSAVWFYSTLKAYLAIRKNDIITHRQWMMRSYAITLAAVTLRIWFPLFEFGLEFPRKDAYVAVSWFCWIPNILFVDWFLLNRKKPVDKT